MAEQAVQVDQRTFSCSICLDLLKDPVTTSCGHSYCMNCIKTHWDQEDSIRLYSCPQCRKTFTPRPDLEKNIMLASLVEQLRNTGLQAAPPHGSDDVLEDVSCDFCPGGNIKAIKSCLVCMASYCEEHLETHYNFSLVEYHMLVEPIKDLQQNTLSSVEGAERESWFDVGLYDEYVLLSEPEPKTRADFLRYSCEITLDPNTAHPQLLLSEGNRKVTFSYQQQWHRSHPDRFTEWFQVLSRESLTGRCYWEVEWKGKGVSVAVAYKDISRAEGGNECGFGYNDKSWAMLFDINSNSFWYNNTKTPITVSNCSRVGVYLDHRAGDLFFYNISETMSLLHRVQTTFTQPLYAGVRMYNTAISAEFCQPR